MTEHLVQKDEPHRQRAPKIIMDADELPHIEALAEGAMLRNPAVANRLLDEISRAKIVRHERMPTDVVTIGSTVTYHDGTTERGRSVTLVYPEHADISCGRISIVTPIGVALIGLSSGSTFFWNTRDNRKRTFKVIEVTQPDAQGSIPA